MADMIKRFLLLVALFSLPVFFVRCRQSGKTNSNYIASQQNKDTLLIGFADSAFRNAPILPDDALSNQDRVCQIKGLELNRDAVEYLGSKLHPYSTDDIKDVKFYLLGRWDILEDKSAYIVKEGDNIIHLLLFDGEELIDGRPYIVVFNSQKDKNYLAETHTPVFAKRVKKNKILLFRVLDDGRVIKKEYCTFLKDKPIIREQTKKEIQQLFPQDYPLDSPRDGGEDLVGDGAEDAGQF